MIYRLILLLSISLTATSAGAQLIRNDLELIGRLDTGAHIPAYYKRGGNNAAVIETKHTSLLAAYNPISLTLKGTMLLYQRVISPQLSRNCPYEITCSNFSKQAIHEFGAVKGIFISADRILRCNRIGLLDVHPLDYNDQTGTISDPPNKYR